MRNHKRHKSRRLLNPHSKFQCLFTRGITSWGLQCIRILYYGSVPTSQEMKRLSIAKIKRNGPISPSYETYGPHESNSYPSNLYKTHFTVIVASTRRPLRFTFITIWRLRKPKRRECTGGNNQRHGTILEGKQKSIYKLMPKCIIWKSNVIKIILVDLRARELNFN
jgi:hypothetical protein